MSRYTSRWLFDKRDHALLKIIDEVRAKERTPEHINRVFYPFFHPRGIREMAESRGLRIAYAVAYLLDSLETDKVENRLVALQSLREEVLTAAEGAMPRNTARALMEIMKELVRVRMNQRKRLELARDFRVATSGKPRLIRRFLRRYHLLEMPEQWNQIAFDDHVHDAGTKGRKSATHLIMDAWIKGIRRLRVIYYNHIHSVSAMELLEAARIMGMDVRIGIEFSARFRGRYAQIIWVPRGFADSQDFLCFLADPRMMDLMARGRAASAYREKRVMDLLERFNAVHRPAIEAACDIRLLPIDPAEFKVFVGAGQASLVHLSKFIHDRVVAAMRERMPDRYRRLAEVKDDGERDGICRDMAEMDALEPEDLMERYLTPEANPDLPDPGCFIDSPDLPEALRRTPAEWVRELAGVRATFRITLNLTDLDAIDALEILYDCEGAITRLEIFNLKDYLNGKTAHLPAIDALQRALNSGNVIALKRMILEMIDGLQAAAGSDPERPGRVEKLSAILHDIAQLRTLYKTTPLKARIGSDSTGQSTRFHGMGLALKESLPPAARRRLSTAGGDDIRMVIPMRISAQRRITFHAENVAHPLTAAFWRVMERLRMPERLYRGGLQDWRVHEDNVRLADPGNIVTLGGVRPRHSNGLLGLRESKDAGGFRFSLKYMRTDLRNGLKVLLGFIPAFATFFFKYDWWVLAWLGAPIWFAITGLRNIVQSVLGGGGMRRSPLLRWNDYVSWDRLTDSLLYTGFSVPLLDLVMKTWVLDHGFGITTATHPISLYAFMALANGIYISSHNIFRGLPRSAAFWNFFRSILSIPIAVLFNAMAGGILAAAGVPGVDAALQKWAAVISKLASDCVAGIIEGAADRHANIGNRLRDYERKIRQLFDIHAQLELMFPEKDVLELLNAPMKIHNSRNAEALDLEKIIIINALDMLYFWMYQPRSHSALRQTMAGLSAEERRIFVRTQTILLRHREISLLMVNGIIGANFVKALAFYLDRTPAYLAAIGRIDAALPPVDAESGPAMVPAPKKRFDNTCQSGYQ